MKYRNFVFDFGNVLARFDEAYITGQFCREDRSLFSEIVLEHWQELDAGTMEYETALKEAVQKAPLELKRAVQDFFRDWYRYLTPIPQTWDFVRELKRGGYRCYILSNAPTYFAEHADYYEIVKAFDGAVFSAPVRMAKPEKEIYWHLFRQFDLDPKECFFLDDKPVNVEGARAVGMDGMVYTGDVEAVKAACS